MSQQGLNLAFGGARFGLVRNDQKKYKTFSELGPDDFTFVLQHLISFLFHHLDDQMGLAERKRKGFFYLHEECEKFP